MLMTKERLQKWIYLLCSLSILFSLFWSIMPMFGWSHYTLDGIMINCSNNRRERSAKIISFTLVLFACVYLIPLIVIITVNTKIVRTVIYVFVTHISHKLWWQT
jgi:hypothetical protein